VALMALMPVAPRPATSTFTSYVPCRNRRTTAEAGVKPYLADMRKCHFSNYCTASRSVTAFTSADVKVAISD
jgi:hypothetical protein